jgi:hypothetical protein
MHSKIDQLFDLLGQLMVSKSTQSNLLQDAQVTAPQAAVEPAPIQPQASNSIRVKRVKSRKQHDMQSAGLSTSSANGIKSRTERTVFQPAIAEDGQAQLHNRVAARVSEILSCKKM